MAEPAPKAPQTAASLGGLRDLAKNLRDASDSTILRVTGVIDQLPERGASDQLLDALRPRLSTLRPRRPPTLSRMLFSPLDPVIVPPSAWRPAEGTIPRTLLKPVWTLVEAGLPGAAKQAKLTPSQAPAAALWPQAGAILAGSDIPEAWKLSSFQASTGIRPNALPPLLAAISLVFNHVELFQRTARGEILTTDEMRPLLQEAARRGEISFSIMLSLLFRQSGAPVSLVEGVLTIARETKFARQLEASLQRVLSAVVDKLDQEPPPPIDVVLLTDAELDAQSLRVSRLAGFGALHGEMSEFSRRLAPRRKQMATLCSTQLATGLKHAAQCSVEPGAMRSEAEQAAAESLESRMRALRRLDLAARPLGDTKTRDTLMAEAAAFYTGTDAPDWLTNGDRLRLCEILVGAEAALQLAASMPKQLAASMPK